MESADGKMSWWRGLWSGSPAARLAIALGGMAVLFAIAVSGSLSRFFIALFGTSRRGVDDASLEVLWRAFLSDITGTPGLFVAALKTLFAVVVAFVAVRVVRHFKDDLKLKLGTFELSGGQSGALLWCVVFALVKLL